MNTHTIQITNEELAALLAGEVLDTLMVKLKTHRVWQGADPPIPPCPGCPPMNP